jgi:hypothetical protein
MKRILALLLLTLPACGDDDDGPPSQRIVTHEPEPDRERRLALCLTCFDALAETGACTERGTQSHCSVTTKPGTDEVTTDCYCFVPSWSTSR